MAKVNVNAARAGFRRDHGENALGIFSGGRLAANYSGNTDTGVVIFPPYKGGQVGWDNQAIPNPYLCDQTQQYPLGAKYVYGYCTYYYTFLQAASSGRTVSTCHGLGVIAENSPQDVTVVTATAAATTLTGAATATANQYAGGWLSIYEATVTPRTGVYRIQSNTVTASSNVIFTLDKPLQGTYSASATCRAHPDPYSNVRFTLSTRTSSANFDTLVGIWVATEDKDGTAAAEGDYGWIQTWGPCYCWAAVAYEGGTAWERDAYHQGGGDIQVNTAADAHPGAQRIGFMLPASCSDPGVSTTGANIDNMEHLIWLQIQP